MLKPTVEQALNQQINEELYSSYLYASMVGYLENANLSGYATWMRIQVQEELEHAQKISHFLMERGGRLRLLAIQEPEHEWPSPLAAFEAAYAHECHISGCFDKLATLAINEEDHATRTFLEWFISEQVEEEANADKNVQQLKLAEGAPGALFMLDREAGQRPAVAAPTQ
jgi:ferritin